MTRQTGARGPELSRGVWVLVVVLVVVSALCPRRSR
jgi:hypothetical protein